MTQIELLESIDNHLAWLHGLSALALVIYGVKNAYKK